MTSTSYINTLIFSYNNKLDYYKKILEEAKKNNIKIDDYWSNWYNTGGYEYNLLKMRNELIEIVPEITQHRGTCLDIGSGDGFWSWILAEWYNVTGIEPVSSCVYLSNKLKNVLCKQTQYNTRFIEADALTYKPNFKYDVIFCRAPNFFNYPMIDEYSDDLKDVGCNRLYNYWKQTQTPEIATELIKRYDERIDYDTVEQFRHNANNARKYLEHLIGMTNKYFIFILSSKEEFYGKYLGHTYNHHPDDVYKLFSEFGKARVRHINGYIYGEIYLDN
jgi:16S rRNA G527 N7-methylase RsmG